VLSEERSMSRRPTVVFSTQAVRTLLGEFTWLGASPFVESETDGSREAGPVEALGAVGLLWPVRVTGLGEAGPQAPGGSAVLNGGMVFHS
jgi:hypothetical protein